jgi:hypothetical protein
MRLAANNLLNRDASGVTRDRGNCYFDGTTGNLKRRACLA